MDEQLIERKKVYEMLNALGGCDAESESWADGWDKAIDMAINELNKIPAADVRSERYGEWIKDSSGVIICSECGEEHEWQDYRASYCDTCGAKMSWEDNDNG